MLWIIPALPLAAVALNLLLGDRLGKTRHRRGSRAARSGSRSLAALRAVLHAGRAARGRAPRSSRPRGPGCGSATSRVDVSFLLDPLSAVMILVVTGVGFLIHVYSTGYMAHDPSFRRFFLYLNLFMFAMLTLVLADNFLLMFVGWEGVGPVLVPADRLLVRAAVGRRRGQEGVHRQPHRRLRLPARRVHVLIACTRLARMFDARCSRPAPHAVRCHGAAPVITLATLLLFLGATGKSAQIPLYVWLPDAMEGPTPVSALIHAATMVTAGVYMVARSHVLFQLAPVTLEVVAVVGAATALFAATIGLAQNDIKRVLAYSTVSQLGYMFMACGVGAFGAGIFHLMTHAFFKALLFLGAGSVIHAHAPTSRTCARWAASRRRLPWTHATMLIATLAIAGIPPFAGFFSKDEILAQRVRDRPLRHLGRGRRSARC